MADKSIIIVGAGISGLCAASYLQMNGYKTQIFEMHNIPGGMCTAWKRKGYTFEGCIDWLVGSSPTNNFHELWKELNAVQGKQMVDFDEYCKVEYEKGKMFTIYTDADKLQEELLTIGPEDEKLIKNLIKDIKTISKVDLPLDKAQEIFNITDYIKYMYKGFPFLRLMGKYSKITVDDYAKKFKNQILNEKLGLFSGWMENSQP
jgi:phytoene dehydrogenase-like protein